MPRQKDDSATLDTGNYYDMEYEEKLEYLKSDKDIKRIKSAYSNVVEYECS